MRGRYVLIALCRPPLNRLLARHSSESRLSGNCFSIAIFFALVPWIVFKMCQDVAMNDLCPSIPCLNSGILPNLAIASIHAQKVWKIKAGYHGLWSFQLETQPSRWLSMKLSWENLRAAKGEFGNADGADRPGLSIVTG